jgi:hypothetical protein
MTLSDAKPRLLPVPKRPLGRRQQRGGGPARPRESNAPCGHLIGPQRSVGRHRQDSNRGRPARIPHEPGCRAPPPAGHRPSRGEFRVIFLPSARCAPFRNPGHHRPWKGLPGASAGVRPLHNLRRPRFAIGASARNRRADGNDVGRPPPSGDDRTPVARSQVHEDRSHLVAPPARRQRIPRGRRRFGRRNRREACTSCRQSRRQRTGEIEVPDRVEHHRLSLSPRCWSPAPTSAPRHRRTSRTAEDHVGGYDDQAWAVPRGGVAEPFAHFSAVVNPSRASTVWVWITAAAPGNHRREAPVAPGVDDRKWRAGS